MRQSMVSIFFFFFSVSLRNRTNNGTEYAELRLKLSGNGKPGEKFLLFERLRFGERSSRSSLAAFTAPTRIPANGMPRIKPRNKPRRPSLVSFSLYEDDSTRSRPQTRVARPFLRPLRRTEIRFVSQEMVDIFWY